MSEPFFHIELRQFPHTARAFNLREDDLRARVIVPWRAGREVEWAEQRFSPAKAKLRVLRSPELRPDQLGMGRGWQEAERVGEDVTAALLSPPSGPDGPVAEMKRELLERCAAEGSLSLSAAVRTAARRWPGRRVSEQLALAEQAVWELLHERGIVLLDGADAVVAAEAWSARLTHWDAWLAEGTALRLPVRGELDGR